MPRFLKPTALIAIAVFAGLPSSKASAEEQQNYKWVDEIAGSEDFYCRRLGCLPSGGQGPACCGIV